MKGVFPSREIPICNRTSKTIYFYKTTFFANLDELKYFFKNNKDTYVIEDEYGKKFLTWKEFVSDLGIPETMEIEWVSHNY